MQKAAHRLLALLGGWPGALLAERFIRHKNRKIGFQTVSWVIVGIHLAAGGWWMLSGRR